MNWYDETHTADEHHAQCVKVVKEIGNRTGSSEGENSKFD